MFGVCTISYEKKAFNIFNTYIRSYKTIIFLLLWWIENCRTVEIVSLKKKFPKHLSIRNVFKYFKKIIRHILFL